MCTAAPEGRCARAPTGTDSTSPILDRLDRLVGIPGTLIHGRCDISSPAITAGRLHRGWPGSTLIIGEGDGHGGDAMVESWRAVNEQLAARGAGRA
jgi:proline iminopeptidase